MSDLIRREDAIEVAYQLRHKPNDDEWNEEWLHLFNAIPTIDAVSVVRCEDCLWGDNEPEVGMCRCRLVAFPLWLRSDGFCSYGERSEDE